MFRKWIGAFLVLNGCQATSGQSAAQRAEVPAQVAAPGPSSSASLRGVLLVQDSGQEQLYRVEQPPGTEVELSCECVGYVLQGALQSLRGGKTPSVTVGGVFAASPTAPTR